MLLTPTNFSRKIDSYTSLYGKYKPKNIHSLEYAVHKLVGTLLSSQLETVFDCEDLSSSTKMLDKFIRELKVEFDCVHSNFEACFFMFLSLFFITIRSSLRVYLFTFNFSFLWSSSEEE